EPGRTRGPDRRPGRATGYPPLPPCSRRPRSGRARPRGGRPFGCPADLPGRGRQPCPARGGRSARTAHRAGAGARPDRVARRRQVHDDHGAGAGAARDRQAGGCPRRRPVVAVLRRRPARRPRADAGPRRRQRRLHPLDGVPRAPGRALLVHAAGDAGPRRRRVRRRPRRDRRRRPVGAGDRVAGRHHAGAGGAGHGRRDPGGQGGHPRGRRPVRRQQGRPGRCRHHRPRPALHAVPGWPALRGGSLAPADREDRGQPRHRQRDRPGARGGRGAPGVARVLRRGPAPARGAGRPGDRGDRAGGAARADGRRARLGRARGAGRQGGRGGVRPLPRRGRAARPAL
ncbi:MAG: putative periplasmic protein kinase ArgK and related GTPases of G3E family, partial [uncultured Blastococcus sp.]